MGGAGPHVHDWGSERIEPCGISCSTRQSPQVTCEARIPATETTPAAGVNVVVVVDGNCILQYTHRQSPCSCLSDGEPLLARRPPPTYGAVPPSPTIPRGPACGQEAGPPPSRRTRGLSVRCCTKACLGDEEEHAERHLHRGVPCGRLTPVPLPRSPSGPWFGVGSVSGGRPGARVVKIWDQQRCPLLEEGDVIAKVNGADVRDLSPGEVESVLQEHTRAGDVILLVERKGHHSRRHPQENYSFKRDHYLHNPSHNKGIPREASNPWGGPPGDTLAVTSFVGPEPRDVLVCPARCSQRLRRPRPAGGAGEPAGGTDGSKEEHGCSSSITIATDGGGAGRAGILLQEISTCKHPTGTSTSSPQQGKDSAPHTGLHRCFRGLNIDPLQSSTTVSPVGERKVKFQANMFSPPTRHNCMNPLVAPLPHKHKAAVSRIRILCRPEGSLQPACLPAGTSVNPAAAQQGCWPPLSSQGPCGFANSLADSEPTGSARPHWHLLLGCLLVNLQWHNSPVGRRRLAIPPVCVFFRCSSVTGTVQ